ncbi:MAG: ABC transporter ATP-binding protein/permease [Nocardioides sp.]|nr:ABC transporter ATP-binding protein/permease [Nocardioides sp.]
MSETAPRSSPTPPPSTAGKLILRSLARNKGRLLAGFSLLAIWQLCETFVPVMIGVVIDRAVATSNLEALILLGVGLAVLFAVLSFSYRFGSRIAFGVMQKEMHELRVEIAAHSLHPQGAKTSLLPGQTLSLATADAEMVGQVIRSVGFTISSVLAVVVSAVVLFSIDIELGFVVILGVPLVLGLIQVVTPVISRRTEHQQSTVADATGVATDLVRGLRVLKGIGAESVAGRRYHRLSQRAKGASIKSTESYGAMSGLTIGLSGLFLAVVALVAGHQAASGEITIGELVAVVGLSQFLAEPIGLLGDISAHTARAHASARRIVTFLHTPRLVDAGPEALDSPTPILMARAGGDGSRVESRPGEILGLALTHPAGAGHLMRVLAGEEAGDVTLDGVPMTSLSTAQRRAHLLVNPHHVDLFEGTLRSNVDPRLLLDDTGLARLLCASSASDVVALADEGLDQHVSPDGATYSGGQRQRIALARALAADTPILVLHDPTTAVDAVTEHRIAEGIRSVRDGRRTTWLITSSPALLAQADRVLLIRDGQVVAEGTHHDLVAHEDYRELVLR